MRIIQKLGLWDVNLHLWVGFFSDIYREIQGPLRIGRVVISKMEPHISHAEKSFGTFGSGTKTSSVKRRPRKVESMSKQA